MRGNERFLINKAPTVRFVLTGSEKKIISSSKQANVLYGYSDKEFSTLTFYDLFPERDKIYAAPECSGTGKKIIRRHVSKHGDEFPVYLRFIKDSEKKNDQITCEIHALIDRNTIDQQDLSGLVYRHLNKSKLGFIVWNSRLEIIHWSQRVESISGLSFDEVYGRSVFDLDLLHSSERDRFKQTLFEALDNRKENFKTKVSIPAKDRGERRVLLQFSVDWDPDHSTVDSMMCLVEDITEGHRQKQALRESEKRYRSLFESSSEGVLIFKEGTFFDCNMRATELFRCSREKIIGKDPIYFSPDKQPDGRASIDAAFDYINTALQQGRKSFEWTHKTYDGYNFYTEINLTKVEIGGDEYLQAIIKDVTRRKEYEQKLIESEKLFRDLFLNSPTAIVMVDEENKVELINDSFRSLFGYEFNELEGRELDPFIVQGGEISNAPKMPAIGLENTDLTKEVVRVDKFGNKKNMIVSGIPVYLKGKPFKGFGLYVDITELKEKEKSIQRSLDDKKVLLGEVHHRVKNNLALISGLLQLQAMKTEYEQVRDVLNESELRIRSIASVHELLYQSSSFSRLSSREYAEALIKQINSIFTDEVEASVSAGEFGININQAIPLGLLINEILLEFTDRKYSEGGRINVKLDQIENHISIEISANGILKMNKYEEEDLTPLLIEALTNQLEATVDQVENGQTSIRITFPVSQKKGAASSI